MCGGPCVLRVLQVHNRYAPGWGGEETVVELEANLLQKWGHTVEQFQVSTTSLKEASYIRQMLSAPGFLWSQGAYRSLRQAIARFSPDIVHVHNTFPLLSPSVLWAARREGKPVVQSLHNFRCACANAVLMRNDAPCEKCVGHSSWPGLRHRCYANSFVRTAAVAAMNSLHWGIGTYARKVDTFIVLNDFSREIFVRSGLPREKMTVKPNFVPVSSLGTGSRSLRIVFAGNMTRHKGLHVLLDAWSRVNVRGSQLMLIGDGPERESLRRQFSDAQNVLWSGVLARPEVLRCIAESRALVLPTLAYENCPMVLLEAFSAATPVIVPDLGSLRTMVSHQAEGLTFRAADPAALAKGLEQMLCASPRMWSQWSVSAQQAHARRYSEVINYEQLISIYRSTIKSHAAAHDRDHSKRLTPLPDASAPGVSFEAD